MRSNISAVPAPDDGAAALIEGLRRGDRRALARAITYAESTLPEHAQLASRVLDAVLPFAAESLRLAISGVPGAGKSTLIEALGQHLISQGRKPAVLAVDPSSPISGGAILGDKTRMERLATKAEAFVRPSPSAGRVGGIAPHTREAILLCEAAGFDVVIVETVGTGQSEIAAAQITDIFVLLQIPGAGDELQAMKKGVLELADILVVNKADVDARAAEHTARDLSRSHRLQSAGADPATRSARAARPVMTVSALTGAGIAELWTQIASLHAARRASGELAARRREQSQHAIRQRLEDEVLTRLRHDPQVREALGSIANDVAERKLSTLSATQHLLTLFLSKP